jgi:hypothetical protein
MIRQLDDEGEEEEEGKKEKEREKARKKRTYAGIPATTSSSLIKACSYSCLTFKKIFIVALASSTYHQSQYPPTL